MINRLATAIATKMFNEKDKYPLEIYIYGIELIISSIIGTSLIILTGLITNSLTQCVIYLITFSLIRVYTGGYHCMSYLKCNILSVASYIIVYMSLYFLESIFANPFSMLGVYITTMLFALIFAPVKNKNKELTQKEQKKYKIISLIMITLFYSTAALLFYIFSVKQMLVILPTCVVIDIAMLISVIINYFEERR